MDSVIEKIIPGLKDERDFIRMGTAEILGNIGDQAAVDPILEMIANKCSSEILKVAIKALGKIGGNVAIQVLGDILKGTWHNYYEIHMYEVRLEAALALGNIGGEKAAILLTEAIVHGNKVGFDMPIRFITDALLQIGAPHSEKGLVAVLKYDGGGGDRRAADGKRTFP